VKKLALFLLFSLNALAQDIIPVHWNCYLPKDVIVCDDIKTSFLSSHPDVKITPQSSAKVSISIRSLNLDNATEYNFIFDGTDKLPDLEWPLTVNTNLSANEISERIMTTLGNLIGIYRTALGQTVQDTSIDNVKYFIEPQVLGSFSSKQGYKNLYGQLGLLGNYSTEKWRIAGYGYTEANTDDYAETIYNRGVKTQTMWIGADLVTVRSFSKHWDVAVLVGSSIEDTKIELSTPDETMPENSLNNKATKNYIKAGVEWIAVPFIQENSNGNIAVRYHVGPEFHRYVDPESYEYVKETFLKHTLTIAADRHFNKVDASLSLQAYKSSLRELPITGVKASTNLTYRITPRLSLGGGYSMEYTKNRVQSPADSNLSFADLTSNNKAAFISSGKISLKFTIGNRRLFNREQRWRN
jgi:hypothetical protein